MVSARLYETHCKSSLCSRRSHGELGYVAAQVLDGAARLLVFGNVVGQSLEESLGVQRALGVPGIIWAKATINSLGEWVMMAKLE